MKLKVHVPNITNQVYWSVAKMAQNEVLKILSPLDAVELPIYLYDSSKEPWNEKSARFDGLISGITEGDIVIFQFPTWNAMEWDDSLIDRMKLYQAKIILFIHDIVPLQFESNYYLMDKFVNICNKCDVLVVPSEKMYRCLVEHGVKNEKYVVQKMWDFKNDIRLHDPRFERKLYFTGEASRFPFVKNWHQETPLYVFGKEDITDSTNVNFGGWLNKYELLLQLSKGGFGLVWGNSENPEDERDYYKMNCSYKLASYLSAGIPVIIPDYLSNADFIREKGIGFVVSSLEEASQVVQSCSEEEYNRMVSNLKQVQYLINNGYFTKKLFVDAIMKLE